MHTDIVIRYPEAFFEISQFDQVVNCQKVAQIRSISSFATFTCANSLHPYCTAYISDGSLNYLGSYFTLLVQKNFNPSLLLALNLGSHVYIKIQHNHWVVKSFDLGRISFPIILILQYGQYFTPLLMVNGEIVLILFFHLILNGFRETILSSDGDLVLRKLTVSGYLIYLINHFSLLRRLRQVLLKIVNTKSVIGVIEDAYHKGLDYIVVNIFHIFLEDTPVFLSHALD